MIDMQLFGGNAGGHHIVSLVFHILNSLLLFRLLLITTHRLWPSAFVAGLFALHPLHVESVAWVSERKDVLSTLFWLWTMLAYVSYARRGGTWRYLGVIFPYVLGLTTKPMLVTLPLVLMLMDYWPLDRIQLGYRNRKLRFSGLTLRRLLAEKTPLLFLALASAVVTVKAQVAAMPAWELMNLPMRITNATVSYWRYIQSAVWPADLAAFYPHLHKPVYLAAAAVFLFLLVVTAGVLYVGRQRKYLVFGWFWYLVTLVPVIGLVQVGDQSHADRYTYVPLIGLFVIAAWGTADIVSRREDLLKPLATAAVLVLVVFGALTWRQVGFWKDDISLFRRAIDVTRDNYIMLSNIGVTYCTMNELDRAMEALEQSYKIRPHEPRTLNAIGTVLLKRQQYQQALIYYSEAVEIQPDFKEAQCSMAIALINMRRFAEAETHCRKAIELDPRWAEPRAHLATILGETGRVDEGMLEARKAIELNPKLALGYFSLAGIYVKKEDFEHAAEQYRKSIELEGDFSAWNNLGNSLLHLDRPAEAEKCYIESIRLNPNRPDPYFNMAISLDRQGRRAEAIEAARKALALAPDHLDIKQYLDQLMAGQPQGTRK
jgi:tetratricopeptide (TPR) repeat protein